MISEYSSRMLCVRFVTVAEMCLVHWILAAIFYTATTQAQGGDVDSMLFEALFGGQNKAANAVNNKPVGPDRTSSINNCNDRHQNCQLWSQQDECTSNIDFMAPHCKRSCGYCHKQDAECYNSNDYCVAWSIRGECQRNPHYMKENCASACYSCGLTTLPEDFVRYEASSPGRRGIEISPPSPPSK